MTMFAFEVKKIIFSNRFKYTLLIIASVIFGLFIRNMLFTDLLMEQQRETVTLYTQEVQKNIRELSVMMEKAEEEGQVNEVVNTQYKELANALKLIYEWNNLLSIENIHWRPVEENKKAFFEKILGYKQLGGEFSITTEELQKQIAISEHHLKTNIRPQSEQFSTVLPNFMKFVTTFYINFGAIVLLLIVVGDILTSEFEQRSIQLLYTQPIKKQSIVQAKILTSIIVFILITAFYFVITILAGIIFGFKGTYDYPVMLNVADRYEFITIKQYIVWGLLSTTFTAILVITITHILSLLIKNSIAVLIVVCVTLLGGFYALQTVALPFNPFAGVLAGQTILEVKKEWIASIPIIVIVAISLYGASIYKISRTHLNS